MTTLTCVLLTRYEHTLSFLSFTFIPSSCLTINRVYVIFIMVFFLFSPKKLTSSTQTRRLYVPINWTPSCFLWIFLTVFSKVTLKKDGYNSIRRFRPLWIGNEWQIFTYTEFTRGFVRTLPNFQPKGPPLVRCLRLFIQYTRSWPSVVEAVSSMYNLKLPNLGERVPC